MCNTVSFMEHFYHHYCHSERLVLYIRKKNSKQSFPFPLYGNYEGKPKINFTWEKHNKENGDSAALWGST